MQATSNFYHRFFIPREYKARESDTEDFAGRKLMWTPEETEKQGIMHQRNHLYQARITIAMRMAHLKIHDTTPNHDSDHETRVHDFDPRITVSSTFSCLMYLFCRYSVLFMWYPSRNCRCAQRPRLQLHSQFSFIFKLLILSVSLP